MKQCKNKRYAIGNNKKHSCEKCGRMSSDAKTLCKASVLRLEKEKKIDKKLAKRKLKLEEKLLKIQEKLKQINCQLNS